MSVADVTEDLVLAQSRWRKARRDGKCVWITYPMSDGANVDYLGPRYHGKLSEVLEFLRDPTSRVKLR